MNILVMGAPGVGKGTYTKLLIEKLHIPHISTGDMFRTELKNQTELGKQAKSYIDKGRLVPNAVTTGMLKKRLEQEDCKDGLVLDGFPRNLQQARLLREIVRIDRVLYFVASDDIIIDRLSGRRICRKCGAIFHIKNIPPKKEGICDNCGGELYQREDDKPKTIGQRLDVYREQTAPLIDYYKNKGLLHEVDVKSPYEERFKVLETIMNILKS